MQAIPFKVHYPDDASLHIQENHQPYQYDTPHMHPEVQISMILEGQGNLHLDSIQNAFTPGDLYIIAPNIPHTFQNDEAHYEMGSELRSHFVSIFFLPEVFERSFSQLTEMLPVRQFFNNLQGGLKIPAAYTQTVQPLFKGLSKSPTLIQWSSVIQILYLIVQNQYKEYIKASNWQHFRHRSQRFYKRLEPVFEYIQANLEKSISLEQVSRLSNMSKSSFGRYFKQYTRKSFSNYLNEMRIQKACKLLLETDFSIYRISLETGFQNLSNFNRHFKKLMKLTPSQFRKGVEY